MYQPDRTCGRPTRSGTPCRIRISGSDVACCTHATEQEQAVAESRRKGCNEGYGAGRESGASSSKSHTAYLEKRVEELEGAAGRRTARVRGRRLPGRASRQVHLSLAWKRSAHSRRPRAVAGKLAEQGQGGPGHTVGVVTRLDTTYRGSLTDIVGRAPATDRNDSRAACHNVPVRAVHSGQQGM